MDSDAVTYIEIEDMIARRHFSSAIAVLSGIVLENPTDSRGWSLLGQGYTEAGHQKTAVAALMRAVLLDDESPATCEALGVAWLRQGDFDTSRQWLHRGLAACRSGNHDDSAHQRGSILRNLAMGLIMEQRFPAAEFLLEEAIEESPKDLLTLHALSAQYINNERYDDASPLLDQILSQPQLPEWLRQAAEYRRDIIAGNA
ncbi:MAG: tetratricopeptide repeat protein [Alkalispirochaeta sp.]